MQNLPHIAPIRLGITGTIASGKSLVGRILAERGIPVLDTDAVVHLLYAQDSAMKAALARAFGKAVILDDGTVDKAMLRDLIFTHADSRKALEDIVHPRVRQATREFLDAPPADGETAGVRAVLVPLLFEVQSESLYDEVWTVTVHPESRLLDRLMQRDGMTREIAHKRLLAQWTQARKAERAHRVIDNAGSIEETTRQVLAALEDLRAERIADAAR